MSELNAYLAKRNITEKQMDQARSATRAYIDAYALREARSEGGMTQVQLAEAMGVSQNRVSRMERGDLSVMSLDTIRRYVEALGGSLSLVADLPSGRLTLL
ncbi:MAG: helix-turn-helix transcriptional regulator [Atopobiaceae bacterium]|nr:helix-turn-helix transcriptional regulator [Atopobiaceae bacterium]